MTTFTKTSLHQLVERKRALLALFATKFPLEARELELLQDVIAQRMVAPEGGEFSALKSHKTAIAQCLIEKDGPMSEKELYERMEAGGFRHDPVGGKDSVRDNIKHLVESGFLVRIGDTKGINKVVDLAKKKTPKK